MADHWCLCDPEHETVKPLVDAFLNNYAEILFLPEVSVLYNQKLYWFAISGTTANTTIFMTRLTFLHRAVPLDKMKTLNRASISKKKTTNQPTKQKLPHQSTTKLLTNPPTHIQTLTDHSTLECET